MGALLIQTLRSRWLAWCVHACLWVLLILTATNLGGRAPDFAEVSASAPPYQALVPVASLDSLFSSAEWPRLRVDTNAPDPFFTRHFVPPPSPAPPPPATTRKIEVTYQGYYQTGDGLKNAVVKLGDGFVVTRVGTPLATNLFVADASMQSLTLTNSAAQTNLLLLNAKKELEVPIK